MCVDSPSSASSDQSPSLRDLIVQAGQTATISNIELKDQYGNIIGKMVKQQQQQHNPHTSTQGSNREQTYNHTRKPSQYNT